ncbi:30S ribosomal protein S12 methylthiotransferase RimO [Catonella massiliensis]|jgi:ribosomal protein S12 methylthiotransferase rimO|uniref:Ribosomal protein uS12 methylthiotransferase RimO n=1 Tax=Catonella massiliensis TaxID=2799636 RepID=A0ABS1IZC1_9FIRM|nr:30S ribosomal protein S12 methylthiotransferase RimO [Catonella massiliensis]MBK5897238.1 30S ribosomal protein S12 methylthiotransferase RimO [Catonella massiliensis]
MTEKIYLVSLGCDKNLVDSEIMLGLLSKEGYAITNELSEADYAIVNSCCFIGDAKEESINTIIEIGELKKEGKLKGLIVTGCLAQRYQSMITDELPEADAVIGTTAYDNIVSAIAEIKSKNGLADKSLYIEDLERLAGGEEHRLVPAGEISSYIKIAEGCNKRCTYCIIPYIRGNYRSIPMETIVKEAEELAKQGTKELLLVAQETTLYGVDIYGKKALPDLVHELSEISGIEWIRLLYCYPEEITDEIIEAIKNEKKVCHYIDLPIQHSSDAILRKMARKTNQAELRERIAKLRKEIPDITLRTTLITGFPGETEEDFKELYNFVDEMEFDRLGVFTYSAEEGTPAAEMDGQVDEEVKTARRNEIMELQQEISAEKAEGRIGKVYEVLVEGTVPVDSVNGEAFASIMEVNEDGKKVYIGRTYMDAPDVDGQVFFESDYEIMSGELVEVEIIASDEYDLFGVLI